MNNCSFQSILIIDSFNSIFLAFYKFWKFFLKWEMLILVRFNDSRPKYKQDWMINDEILLII